MPEIQVHHFDNRSSHQAEQLLLQNFSPAAVLVNSEGDILYLNRRTESEAKT